MTVLLNSLNSKINNRYFSIKKSSYLESAIPENKILASNSEWMKPNIDQRSIYLYNIFKQI